MCNLLGCNESGMALPLPVVTDAERRAFLAGLAALPLATVLAWPDLARAAAAGLAPVSIDTPSGGKATGVLAMPAKTPAPTLLLVHEWWGLNDQIKAVAAEYAKEGYIAMAIDLYGGKVASAPADAKAYMSGLDAKAATEQVVAAAGWLRKHDKGTGKLGTVGWCFGGGWSLNTSIATPVDATVIYYGRVNKTAGELKSLKGPVLGHFGTKDKSINKEMVGGFEAAMKEAGKAETLTVHWYEADHAFANPTGARYDAEDAKLAWQRTLAFYKKNLG